MRSCFEGTMCAGKIGNGVGGLFPLSNIFDTAGHSSGESGRPAIKFPTGFTGGFGSSRSGIVEVEIRVRSRFEGTMCAGKIGDGVLLRLRQCHFTGGDGEVDDNIFADRQSCFAVEGIIAIVLSGNFFDGFILRINHDRVSLGISVVSGIAGCFRSTGEAIGLREIPFGFSTKISRSYTSR